MSRDPITRMDVDTRWMFTDHARKLQTAHPTDWPTFWCAYQAVLAESWWKGQRVTLADAWSPTIPCSIEEAQAALQAADLLDKAGRVTLNAWKKWFEPALERIERRRAAGKAGAESRWNKHGERTPKPMRSHSEGDAPRHPSTPSHAKPRQVPDRIVPSPDVDTPEPDALDAWFRLTGSWPSRKVVPWLEDLARDHGHEAVSTALAEEVIADEDRRTLLGRTQSRLERVDHQAAKDREAAERAAAAAERDRIETMPEEQRTANMKRLRDQMVASGLVPADPTGGTR